MATSSRKKKRPSSVVPATGIPAKVGWPEVNWKLFLLQIAIIAVAGLWIFWPVLHGDWLWDDSLYLTKNPLLHDPARLWKIWFQPGAFIEYYPIEETVQWAQWQLWENETFGYHLTNALLHIVNALLVWRLFSKLHLRLAWLGGLIFAVHPANVESVAWIAELKNTLSLTPFLLAMGAWIDYEKSRKNRDYFLALGFFLVAMLCKITVSPFPVVILLYAWWKRGRIGWNDLKASVPFFVISLILGYSNILVGGWYSQHSMEPVETTPMGGPLSRLALAGLSISFYFTKCFWPLPVMPVYPKWTIDPVSPIQFLPWLILGGVIFLCWMKRATWGRHVLLGLGFFLILIAPFIGFIEISYMNFTWVMDHFLYIPMIGLIGLVVAGLGQLENQLPAPIRFAGIGVIAVVMALLAWQSHEYAGRFVSQEALWSYTLQRNPEAWPGYVNLGNVYLERGEASEAIAQYSQAVRVNPRYARGYYNIGCVLTQMGRTSESIPQYEQALKIHPDFAMAHYNLGNAFAQMNQFPEAIEQFQQAVKFNPYLESAYNNLGNVLARTNRLPEAIGQFEAAINLAPNNPGLHDNLGDALARANRIPEAIEQYNISLQINPNDARAQDQLKRLTERNPSTPETLPSGK